MEQFVRRKVRLYTLPFKLYLTAVFNSKYRPIAIPPKIDKNNYASCSDGIHQNDLPMCIYLDRVNK